MERRETNLDYIGLGRKIRFKRKSNGLTQEQLAERTGISISFLGHIERGSRKASLETLVKLANALEVSLDYLLQDSLDSFILSTPHPESQIEALNEIQEILDNVRYLRKSMNT